MFSRERKKEKKNRGIGGSDLGWVGGGEIWPENIVWKRICNLKKEKKILMQLPEVIHVKSLTESLPISKLSVLPIIIIIISPEFAAPIVTESPKLPWLSPL